MADGIKRMENIAPTGKEVVKITQSLPIRLEPTISALPRAAIYLRLMVLSEE
jgi:hypothetical protein